MSAGRPLFLDNKNPPARSCAERLFFIVGCTDTQLTPALLAGSGLFLSGKQSHMLRVDPLEKLWDGTNEPHNGAYELLKDGKWSMHLHVSEIEAE